MTATRSPWRRIDLRLAEDSAGELYVLTKGDGMIRELRSVK